MRRNYEQLRRIPPKGRSNFDTLNARDMAKRTLAAPVPTRVLVAQASAPSNLLDNLLTKTSWIRLALGGYRLTKWCSSLI